MLTAADGISGGCGVAVKRGIGLARADTPLVKTDLDHRICHAHVGAVLRGGLHCFSVYPRHSMGATGDNLEVLEVL